MIIDGTHRLPTQMGDQENGPPRARSFVQRISPANLLLLKAALLDEDAAIAAYRAWRPTLDFATISLGQQRLLPLLQRNLIRFGIEDPLIDRFREIRRYFLVRNLKAMAFGQRVFATLDQIGVPFIVLKGAALIACYLADRSLRPMEDIDILVPEDRLANAIAVLTAMNLHPQGISPRYLMRSRFRRFIPGCAFVGPDQNIDLHWKALHLDLRPEADDQFWQAHRQTSLDGTPIRVLDPAHQLVHICAHAAQPGARAAAERWPADAILVIRGGKDLCARRLMVEADQRGLSAIMAEALAFLAQEFDVSISNLTISRMRASATWTERAEMRVLASPSKVLSNHWRSALLDCRCISREPVNRLITRVLPAYLIEWAQVNRLTPALFIAVQVALGRPGWLRRILGWDRHRIRPDTDRLPKVGDTLEPGGPNFDETPLIAGWWDPEPSGCWTSGPVATVAWCVRGADHDLTLLIAGEAALHEKESVQRIDLFANDRRIASWRFQADTLSALSTRVLVPGGLIRNRDVLMLTFLIHRPISEAQKGLYLRSLTLKALQK